MSVRKQKREKKQPINRLEITETSTLADDETKRKARKRRENGEKEEKMEGKKMKTGEAFHLLFSFNNSICC